MPDFSPVTAGAKRNPARSASWLNAVSAAAAHFHGQVAGGAGHGQYVDVKRDATIVKVKNLTASDLLRGHYVQIGALLLDEVAHDHIWLEGNLYASAESERIAILLKAAKEDDIVKARMIGICTARVDVTDTAHRFAAPADGEFLLVSADSGPAEIISDVDATGEQEVAVLLGGSGGGGTVTIQYGRALVGVAGMRKAPAEPTAITASDGTVSTWTSATAGVLTLASGHGIADETYIDIFWASSGALYRSHVTAVTATTVTFESDANLPSYGDDLPAASTEVLARERPETGDWAEIDVPLVFGTCEFLVYETIGLPAEPSPAVGYWPPALPTRMRPGYNDPDVPGRLTTRTDDETGTLTMDSAGHGIATGNKINISWASGARYNITVGTVSGTSVPIGADNSGDGDPLPPDETDIMAIVRNEANARKEIWELPIAMGSGIAKNGWAAAINGKVIAADYSTLRDPADFPEPPPPP